MLTYNAQTLAYIGDAVYELRVREHLLATGHSQAKNLHRAAIERINAAAQQRALNRLYPLLTEAERDVVRRGRNAPLARKSRKEDLMTYKLATGLEALIGRLHLSGEQERLDELFDAIL